MVAKLDERFRDKLNRKLEAIVLHVNQLKNDKRIEIKGFNEQIKAAEKKMKALAETLNTDDQTLLTLAFNNYEIEALEK